MTNEQLTAFVSGLAPGAEIKQGAQYLEVVIPAEQVHEVAKHLNESDETAFDFLFCLTGVDYTDHLKVVYHLESTVHKHLVVLKAKTADRNEPVVDSVADLWPTAEFHECEVFDLLGIKFKNNPDLRRLFLDDDWGHPLRLDYVDDIHIVSR